MFSPEVLSNLIIFVPTIFAGALAAGADYLDMAMSLSEPHPTHPHEQTGVKLGDDQFAQAPDWETAGRLALVGMGALTRDGFSTLVDYLSPVYWAFMSLSALALIVLRRREPLAQRPFRVPLYPWLPLAFAASSLYVLWSSVVYVKAGALVGLGVLALGLPLLFWQRRGDPG